MAYYVAAVDCRHGHCLRERLLRYQLAGATLSRHYWTGRQHDVTYTRHWQLPLR